MSIHNMKLASPHFENVKSGIKEYEIRVFDDKRRKLLPGDVIEFRHNEHQNKTFKRVIVGVTLYKTFTEAMKDCGLKKALPNIRTIKDGVALYESFPGYKEGAQKNGVVSFKLAKAKSYQQFLHQKNT